MISTKLKQSKNRIFLLEITINLLLFSALLIVGLLFFIKTHKLTEETQVLHEALMHAAMQQAHTNRSMAI